MNDINKLKELLSDIQSVANMLDGNTEREKIANYVREYILEPLQELIKEI